MTSATYKNLEYQRIEHQRKNPHLYTTMTSAVNADGTVTTFEQVTAKTQESLDKLYEIHKHLFGEEHCNPLCQYSDRENKPCYPIECLERDKQRVLDSFVRNYIYIRSRREVLND